MQFDQIGPYEIDAKIGQGGMGTVYQGHNMSTGQQAAIKILSPQLALTEGFRERFQAEIESLRKLRHKNIVRLYGHGEQNGLLFYSMELIKGSSLEEEIQAGRRFNWREVTQIGIHVSQALGHAHNFGIIHRDIKPANLLLDGSDEIKLSDFGIAQLFGVSQLTATHGVLGTVEYMAPEQADSRPTSESCDQYSLGCVLYALLAGKPPFRASSVAEVLQMQRFAKPDPVRRYNVDIPQDFERIIMQLLAKDPQDRFRNMLVLTRQMQAMEQALSLSQQQQFDLEDPSSDRSSLSNSAPLAETRAVECVPEVATDGSAKPRGSTGLSQSSSSDSIGSLAEADTTSELTDVKSQFVSVEEDDLREKLHQRDTTHLPVLQLTSLAAALTIVIGLTWYLSRPPSADTLFRSIQAASPEKSTSSLLRVEDKIRQFLLEFPDDPRIPKLAQYGEQIDLANTANRLSQRTKHNYKEQPLLPIEQMYLQAMEHVSSNPRQTQEQLQTLIDLYDDGPIKPAVPEKIRAPSERFKRQRQCLDLAKSQLVSVSTKWDKQRLITRKILEERLRHAQFLRDRDPARAARIWWAIQTTYGGEEWAFDIVEKARRALAILETDRLAKPSTGKKMATKQE